MDTERDESFDFQYLVGAAPARSSPRDPISREGSARKSGLDQGAIPAADRISALSEAFPWPTEQPQLDTLPQRRGWLGDGPRQLLDRELSPRTRLVVELGAWLGLSTRFIADHAPNAVVVSVDHWRGSPEHHRQPRLQALLPRLYEAFLVLSWPYRDRVIPLRMATIEGLQTVAAYGLSPDLIFVDAEHSYEAVRSELELTHQLFPRATLVGDDYDWKGVQNAVIDFAHRHDWTVEIAGVNRRAWKLLGP